MKHGLTVESVASGSIASELEISPGDVLAAINGHTLHDVIDYTYYSSSSETLLLDVRQENGMEWEAEIELLPGESLGLTFNPPSPMRCGNNCVFCFVHQMPKGMRKPLYVKDEDYRLSFLNGNYITLTNLKEREIRRIARQRLSPLYISVHATDPAVREKLLGKKGIPPILVQLEQLAEAGIRMHTQTVLCPGLNDGPVFEQTVEQLASLYPRVQSLAVVPVGITGHRKGLPRLDPVDGEYAAIFLKEWLPRMKALNRRLKGMFLQIADEFFIKSGQPFPPLSSYGDLPQLENGVGMVPLFLRDAKSVLRRARPCPAAGSTSFGVITGESFASTADAFLMDLGELCRIEISSVPIPNLLFGGGVTVTGLVTGGDIAREVIGRRKAGICFTAILLPDVMLKEGEGVFLDNMDTGKLAAMCGCPVRIFDSTPAGLYRTVRDLCRR